MKKLLSVLLVVLFVSSIFAQKGPSVSVGANLSLPMSKFSDVANTGFGATARGELPLAPNIVGMATVGYITWGGKSVGSSMIGGTSWDYSYSCIPLLAGIKYYFSPGGFYGFVDLGLNMFSVKVEWKSTSPYYPSGSESSSETKFGAGFGAGYELMVGKSTKLDISGKYHWNPDDLHYLDIRAGVKFPL